MISPASLTFRSMAGPELLRRESLICGQGRFEFRLSSAGRQFFTGLRVVLLATLTLAVVASAFTGTTNSGESPRGLGGGQPIYDSHGLQRDPEFGSVIVGNVSIVNSLLGCAFQLNPNGTLLPRPDVSTQLVIMNSFGETMLVPMRWYEIFNCGSVFGSFSVSLLPGSYFISLSYCSENSTNGGCDQLPVKVSVGSDGRTQVVLDIEYGWASQGNSGVLGWHVTLRVFPPNT